MPFLLLLAACDTTPPERVRAPIPPLVAEGAVVTTVVTRSPDPVPARFAVPMDRWLTDSEPPPIGKIRHALCTDQPGAREAVLAALRSSPGDGLPWAGFDQDCRDPGWCRWVGATLAADPAHPRLAGLWWDTRACPDPEISRLVSASAPWDIVVDRAGRTRSWDPRLEALAVERLRQPGFELDAILRVMAEIDDPAAERALLALHHQAPRSSRDTVAFSLWGRPSSEAIGLFRDVCSRIADERCGFVRNDPLSTLSSSIEDGMVDPDDLFARFPHHRGAVLAALDTCAEDGIVRRPCVVALAREDRAAALALVTRLDDPALADLATVLAIPDRGGVLLALQELGFPALAVPATSRALTVPELLEASGHAVRPGFGWAWPPHQEQLLYSLAAVAGVAELEFDELVPPFPPFEQPPIAGRTPATTLYSWSGGWRYRTLVPAQESWDIPSAVGFVNAVLVALGSDRRLALDEEQSFVIAGTTATLAGLEDEGWVRFYRPPPAEAEGEGYTVTPIVDAPVTLEPTDEL